jgi:hypothetical protein
MSSSIDRKDEHGSQEPPRPGEQTSDGHSGEGAASAMAHMISQGQHHRHQNRGSDDAAGSSGS